LVEQPKGYPEVGPLGYRTYRGIIHCHSFHSHDSPGSYEEIREAAEETGVNFIIMTDHPSPEAITEGLRGWYGDVLFLVGAELSRGGNWSILALDLNEYIDQNRSTPEIIEEVKRQGGLVFLGHIEGLKEWPTSGFDGIELYNIHADFKDEALFLLILKGLLLPPGCFFSSNIDLPRGNLARWDRLTRQQRVPAIAGNDAHANVRVFLGLAGTVDSYQNMFRIVATYILAPNLSKDQVKRALKSGHCYIGFDIWGPARGFTLWAEGPHESAIMGDEITWERGLRLLSTLPGKGLIKLYRNGQVIRELEASCLDYPLERRGTYRIEVYRGGKPWIISNPIYVK